jgi:hypothetical protein
LNRVRLISDTIDPIHFIDNSESKDFAALHLFRKFSILLVGRWIVEHSMMRMTKTTCILLLSQLLCLCGCGYFSSGTWEDDPNNWGRAFSSKKPDNVIILHSKYWRSPHWTYEFQYFFEIEQNDDLKKQLFTKNKLVRLEGEAAKEAIDKFFGDSPKWFAPKTVENYEVWGYEDKVPNNFRFLVDKVTGNIYLADYQV